MDTLRLFLAHTCKAVLIDADGTFYDGGETVFSTGGASTVVKRRHVHDGQGISFIRGLGLRILFVTGEGEPIQRHVEKFNGLPSARSGAWAPVEVCANVSAEGKVDAIDAWLKKHGLAWGTCLYIGDDMNDLAAMKRVSSEGGLVCAPRNATRRILELADHVTKRDGGNGAIREIAEMIIDARGIDETTLPLL